MRITIIGPSYPYRGGIALFSNRLAEALIEDGNEVNIITFKLQYPRFLFPGKTQYSTDSDNSGLKITREINSVNPFSWIRVGRLIKKDSPDLVIFKYWMPFMSPCYGSIASIVKKDKKTKVLAIVHNLLPHERHFGDTLLSKYFLRNMNGFIAMSKSVLDDLNKFEKIKPKLFSPHPLYDNFGEIKSREEALDRLGLDHSFQYMLFFGIIRKYKGLDILLKAFADKRLNNGTIKLLVVGEFYESNDVYLELIKKHQLENNVVLINRFIPDGEVVNYFCAADIIVQPYKHATQSGVTQIAYHFERPMLVTDVGGLKEIVPHNKVGYVTMPDEKEVAEALVDFYKNDRSKEFIKGIKDEKRKYTWQKMVDSIYRLCEEVA